MKIKNLEHLQDGILRMLPTNKADAVQLQDICSRLGMCKRDIKEIIKGLRSEYPICAKDTEGGGYWLADNDSDIKEFMRLIEARKLSYDNTIANMRQHLKEA